MDWLDPFRDKPIGGAFTPLPEYRPEMVWSGPYAPNGNRACPSCAQEVVFDGDIYSTGHCGCPGNAYCRYPLWMVWSQAAAARG